RRPKLRELKEAATAIFRGPYTVKYPYEPSIPPETFRGKPEYVEEECVGCGGCAQVCPARAIEVTEEVTGYSGKRKLTLHYDHCIFCGQCQRYCPTEKGIRLTNEYDLATYDRTEAKVEVEKDLVICEYCGAVVGTADHIRWVAQKLGARAYANLGLALMLYKDLELVPEIAPRPEEPIARADHIRFLCPKCRRELILFEQWGP
ncbi:putative dissimilatory sulfite reductase B (dsrB), partial [marine sediment metagenome]